jgi:hypothetical protein
MRIPDALLVDLVAAAGIILEHDDPFWYAVDARTAEPLAQGSDAGRVAREALAALRGRLDHAEGGAPNSARERAVGASGGAGL